MNPLTEIAQWVVNNRYPKNESDKVSDSEMYNEILNVGEALYTQSDVMQILTDINKHFEGRIDLTVWINKEFRAKQK